MPSGATRAGVLGSVQATALVAGSMLGIGIFIAPPVVAGHVESPALFIALWLAGGISALFGAMAVGELGAMMPRAGGDYPYLRHAYGPRLAFAAGWLQLLAIFPGSLASMAVATAAFQLPTLLGDLYDLPSEVGIVASPEWLWAVVVVIGLTAVNHLGVVISGRAQVGLTIVPIAVLLAAGVMVLVWQGTVGGVSDHPIVDVGGDHDLEALALAFLPVYFAYSGWNAAIFVGGEIRDPGRNLPRALIGGTLAVTVLYLVLCFGFLAVFGIETLRGTGEAGTAAAVAVFGPRAQGVIALLIFLAMLGSINGTILAGSRIAYAMAKVGHCVPAAGRLSGRYATPVVALWLQAAWTVVLIVSHTFEELINYTSAAMLITGTLTVLAVIVLRKKRPTWPRPYKTWGYPFTPIIYAVASVVVLVVLVLRRDPSVFLGAGWFAAALVVHRVWLSRRVPTGRRGSEHTV